MSYNSFCHKQTHTGKLATYQISDGALAALMAEKERNRPGPDGEVFTDPNGFPFNRNYLPRALGTTLRENGFRHTTLKDLRHTFGYIAANFAGCPLPILQNLMGHTDVKMTMRYVRHSDAQPYLKAFFDLISE